MRLFIIVLLTFATALLTCVESSSVSKMAVDDMPPKLARTPERFKTNRVMRISEANIKEDEERVISAAVESLAGLVKAEASKLGLLFNRDPSAAQVLKAFRLDRGMGRALASPNLKAMENYLKEARPNQKSNTLVIGMFTAHYGDDVVAKALVTGQTKAQTVEAANLVRRLRQEQRLLWLDSGKSVDDVFKLLKLRQDGYTALVSRKLEVLDDYMKLYIHEKSSGVTLLQTLTKGFGGEWGLAKLLARAQENSLTSELAKALQNALLNKWLTSKVHPNTVFRSLRLDEDFAMFLDNPIRNTLDRYVSLYNAKNPNSKASLSGILVAHYGELSVAGVLVSARMLADTKEFATKLQREQLQGWINSQKSAGDVFTLLKIKEYGRRFMISPRLETLDSYVKLFNMQNPQHKTDMITVLSTGFGGDGKFAVVIARSEDSLLTSEVYKDMMLTASQYQFGLFKRWWRNKVDPTDIYTTVFNVDRAAAGRWETSIARQYTTYYNEKIFRSRVNVFNNPRRS